MWDRHALDTFNPDLNYLALGLALVLKTPFLPVPE